MVPDGRMKRLARAAGLVVVEAGAIVREAILIPLRLWVRAAEVAGRVTLAAWHVIKPILRGALRALLMALRIAAEVITPARAVAAVVVCASVLLAISQFVHFRGVEIGAPEYQAVQSVAPPPQEGLRTPLDQHGVALLVVAAAAIAITGLALAGRWRLARGLVILGAVAVAITLIGDAPAGVDEGDFAIKFEGVHATLLGGFWAQLSASAVIALAGPILAVYLRLGHASTRRARRGARGRLATGGARS